VSISRVLITTDVVGGVWDFCLALATELRAASTVTLLTIGEPDPAQRHAAAGIGVELLSAPLRLEWMQDAEADVEHTRDLVANVARETRADIVHANQFAAACANVDVPVVLTLHSDVLSWRRWTLGADGIPAEWQPYTRLVRTALARADTVVAVSEFLRHEIAELYGVQKDIEVVYNGWPPPTPTVGYPARRGTLLAGRVWDAAKNIGLAAEAAHGWDPGQVYLAGSRTNPDNQGVAQVPPPLRPLGRLSRDELDARLAASAIYLSPARYDPFGLLPVQAALHGCALLLSDIPSYRELWDGAACFFVSNDPTHLRRQWQWLVASHAERADLQRRAAERARVRFSSTRMAENYGALYAHRRKSVAA
jgi:glycogen synthase